MQIAAPVRTKDSRTALRELVVESARLAELPGLPAEALRWQAEAVDKRRLVARDAARLATPRIWTDTIAGLSSTGWRLASTAAPDAPVALLSAAAAASGLPVGPPQTGRGTIERAQRLVRAGGPAYTKLGQFIATADGLLPQEWVDAFAWCRDEARPLRPGTAEKIVERELAATGAALGSLDPTPLAAGSIGQVHRGMLSDGTEVVIKVRRPRLQRRLRKDIETLALVAAAAERLHPAAASANLAGFVELFAQLTLEELDFQLEAANLVESCAVLEALGAEHVRVPRPIPGMVTERLLVMEYLPGVSYARLADQPGPRPDGDRLLKLGVQSVLEATLIHGVFHGDMHAGNVLIDGDGDFALVDFGITGRLDERQRAGLVRFLFGFATSDARVQVEALQTFGAIAPGADLTVLIARMQRELDQLQARQNGAVTFDQLGQTLGRLLGVLASGGMTMPKDLVLFFKNLLYLSGFAASVAPEADLFAVIEELLTELFAREGNGLAALLAQATQPA
jgi:ubiquinone biosynthesis protein